MQSVQEFEDDLGIAAGVLCFVALIGAVVQTWGWNKRQGQATIDCFTLMKFVLFWSNHISTVLFVVAFASSFYFWVFFKVTSNRTLLPACSRTSVCE